MAQENLGPQFDPVRYGQRKLAEEGGFSVKPTTGEEPKSGVMVASFGSERSVKGIPSEEELSSDLEQRQSSGHFSNPRRFWGGWLDQNRNETDLDTSTLFSNEDRAREYGRRNLQRTVYDVGSGQVSNAFSTPRDFHGTLAENDPAFQQSVQHAWLSNYDHMIDHLRTRRRSGREARQRQAVRKQPIPGQGQLL